MPSIDLNLNDAASVVRTMDAAADLMRASPQRTGCVTWLADHGRLLVTGDLHDNPFHFDAIVPLARLDESSEHHVVLHELIHGDRLLNGMDFSYRMLGRVADLVCRHPGQVHIVLANHELAQLTGRGVSKGAGNSVELFDDALEYAFGDVWREVEASIHRFIRAMPLALRSRSGIFCAHSLPAPSMMSRFDLGVFERELTDTDYAAPHGAAYLMTWGRSHTLDQIAQLGLVLGVSLFCLGHQHVETGIEIRGPRLIVLNSDHAGARILPVNLASLPTAEEAMLYAIPLAAVG